MHRAVRLIAEGIGSLTFVLYEGAAELSAHPLLDLLARPNPRQDGAALLEAVSSHLLLASNAYVEAVGIDGDTAPQGNVNVRELYALRPDRMKVVPGPDGWPQAYEYTVAGSTVRFEQSAALPPILQLTLFNPLDDYYGLSPLEAAAAAVDTHNAAAKWNKALLDNAARPSGALVYDGPEGAVMSDAQFERLKKELADQYQGTANAGRPLLLEGGLDWKAMSLSPKDMDFMEAKHSAAREIALAFGVPPMLLAIPPQIHIILRPGARPRRSGRADQQVTRPARAARRFCVVCGLRGLAVYALLILAFSPRSPARSYIPSHAGLPTALIWLACRPAGGAGFGRRSAG